MKFNGSDYVPQRDDGRLTSQYDRIFTIMQDGEFRSLEEISQLTSDPQASISAQLRHMRKPRFGSHKVEKEYVENGLFKYRLVVNNGVTNNDK